MRSCSLRRPRELLRRRRAGLSNQVPGRCGFNPAAIALAQSHSASRFGMDPMRPSDETERMHSTTASEVLDWEDLESNVSKRLAAKSVGYAWSAGGLSALRSRARSRLGSWRVRVRSG